MRQLVAVSVPNGEALMTFVASLPANLAAPIIIAPLFSLERAGRQLEQLRQDSALPVVVVQGNVALLAGTVYLLPADQHVDVAQNELVCRQDAPAEQGMLLFFEAAASVFEDRLIAVFLNGTGPEGAACALAVKKTGGTVILQNPPANGYDSVPRSLSPTSVDFMVELEEISPILQDLITGSNHLLQSGENRALQNFLRQLHERSGLDFTSYKTPTIQRRLQRRMVATGSTSLAAYTRYLQQHQDEYSRLISTLLIKVTEFFRDRELFVTLREQILPELIAASRRRGNELRIWSAGCATGEEAYSLAILIADLLGDELERFTVRIFATDLDNDAINYARRGIYPASALTAMPPELVARFFQRIDSEYEVQKRIRGMVIFGLHDLGQRAPFPRIDLVLCRNVLIYFTVELQKRVLQLFAYSLRDGGYLVLGKAETTSPLAEFFAPVQPSLKIYRRQGDRTLIPLGQLKDTTPLRPASILPGRSIIGSLHLPPSKELSRHRTSLEKLGALVFNLPVGVVVVDHHYDIQIINSLAHSLLGIHRSAIGEDLLHLADSVPTKPLRAIIDAALRGEDPFANMRILSVEIETGEQRQLQIVGYPQQLEGENGTNPSVLLLVTDVSASFQTQQQQSAPAPVDPIAQQHQADVQALTAQVQRLMEANHELREANQELAATNLELHQANEEYLVNTEEVQAAAEEVETLNEELQATNEELETLNEELQATVEELNATNDDLEARSAELQELAQMREVQHHITDAERAQLATILGSMSDAVLVVDAAGKAVRTNAAYDRLFGDAAKPFIPQDEMGQPLPPDEAPQRRAARGETFSMTFSLSDADNTRRWFEANGHPLQTEGAGVLVIRDITERSLRRMQDDFMALASHELRTPLTSTSSALQMLVQKLSGDSANPQTLHLSEIALRQINYLITQINDLTDLSRLQTGKLHMQLETVDVIAILRQTIEAMRLTAPEREITLTAPEGPVMVQGDPMRLEQIFTNLLTNALKYSGETARIDMRAQRTANTLQVQVQDYGPGIAASQLPHLFTRFYQIAHPGGQERSGLGRGLFIVHELVLAHNGQITVDSHEGQGTQFVITLPVQQGT